MQSIEKSMYSFTVYENLTFDIEAKVCRLNQNKEAPHKDTQENFY